jgi:hypothetical protein
MFLYYPFPAQWCNVTSYFYFCPSYATIFLGWEGLTLSSPKILQFFWMKNRIKSMMPNGITGLESVNKILYYFCIQKHCECCRITQRETIKATWPQRFAAVQIECAINQSLSGFFSKSSGDQRTIHLHLMTNTKTPSQVVHLLTVRQLWLYD